MPYAPDPWNSSKILITGATSVGKTAFVGAASDAAPVRTIETIPTPQRGEDAMNLDLLILDMGRIAITDHHVLTLVGAPLPTVWDGLWPDVARGALGAVVLVHPDSPEEAFPAVETLEEAHVPFQVVIAHLDGTTPDPHKVGQVLEVDPARITVCDPRSRVATRFAIGDVVSGALKLSVGKVAP
jgi:signal recognition particle receptor subunit beta